MPPGSTQPQPKEALGGLRLLRGAGREAAATVRLLLARVVRRAIALA